MNLRDVLRRRTVAASLLSLLVAGVAPASEPPARETTSSCAITYTVRVVDPASRLVTVDATLDFTGAPGPLDLGLVDVDDHYTPGYAQFVGVVRMVDARGTTVELAHPSKNRWRPASDLVAGRYRLSYAVHVDHAAKPSAWGLKETPTLGTDGGVLIGAALFVFPSVPAEGEARPDAWRGRVSLSVGWVLPSQWRVVAPWPEAGASRQRPDSLDDLLDNFVLVSPANAYDLFAVSIGASRVAGAVRRGVWSFPSAMLWRAFERTIRESGAIFGRMPSRSYLLVVDPELGTKERGGLSDGGGAARGSFHAALDEKHTSEDVTSAQLLGTLAHETFHWWNPTGLPPAVSADFYWWHEGFTVYYAALVLWRAGFLSADGFVGQLASEYTRGERQNADRPGTSLVEASRKIAGEGGPEYNMVYGLGAVFGLALDVELRRSSGGAHSLDDLMRALYERHDRTGRGFSYDDLVAEASRLAGSDIRSFFDGHVTGHERFDWPKILAEIGYSEQEVATGRPFVGFGYDESAHVPTIARVLDGAPADGVLEPGDVIRAIDGTATETTEAVSRELGRRAPGDRVSMRLERNGEAIDVPIVLGERREARTVALAQAPDGARRLVEALGRSRAAPTLDKGAGVRIFSYLEDPEIEGDKWGGSGVTGASLRR